MWVYYTSKDNVFWTNDTIDKPSKQYLESITWEEAKINVDMENIKVVTFFTKDNSIRLLKIVNDETNETYYYYFNKILRLVKSNWLVEFYLDYWLTYTIKLLDENIIALAERHQEYEDDGYLMWVDNKLNDLKLSYTNYILKSSESIPEVDNGDTISFMDAKKKYQVTLNKGDMLNSVYTLVIKDSDIKNQSYTYIPILSEKSKQSIKLFEDTRELEPNDYIPNGYWSSISASSYRYCKFSLSSLFDKVKPYLDEPNFYDVSYNIETMEDSPNKWLNVKERMGNALYFYVWRNKDRIGWFIDRNITSQPPLREWFAKNPNSQVWPYAKNLYPEQLRITAVVHSRDELAVGEVNNDFESINELITKSDLLPKIMGMYIFPNFFKLEQAWAVATINNKKFLSYNIPTNGRYITSYELGKFDLDKEIKFNNTKPIFKNMLMYYEVNWLNNFIDVSKLVNESGVANFSAWLNFTSCASLTMINNKINVKNQTVIFPSQQPIVIDKYREYIVSNMNTVNTGYAIKKQERDVGIFKGLFGLIGGGLSAASGNIGGAFGGFVGSSFGLANSVRGLHNYEKQVRAHYADKDTQLGNQLLFSSINDMIYNPYLTTKKQFDLLMMKGLTQDSIIQMNNTLLLYGVYNPKYMALNLLPTSTQHLGFKYLKLDEVNVNQYLSKLINQPIEIKEIMLSQIIEWRIWDIVPHIPNIEKTPE